MSNSPKIVRSHPEWTRERPTREGTFGVRGFNLGAAPGQQFETVVLVRRRDDGHLVCNLHESTSEDRFARWPRLDALSDAFEWIEYAPVDRSLGASDFAQWLASEMPAGTIIGSPTWWAEHILHRLARDLAPPAPAAFPTGEDDADTEQFRRGWQAGFAEGRLQPATVTQPAEAAARNTGEPYVPDTILAPAISAFNATRQAMTEALRAQGPEGKKGAIEDLAIEAALKVALSTARPPAALPLPGDQGSVQELFNPLPTPDRAIRKRAGQVYEQAMAAGATHGQAWRAALTAILADSTADQPGKPAAPSIAAAEAMGAQGGPADDAERLAFEAWMNGHCWALCATWDGKGYTSEAEQGGGYCEKAALTRRLWAAWRDRAALAREPAAFDFAAHLQHQREWSERTFGPGPRTAGVIDHIRKELREIEAAPHDGEEWIDAVILALDGAWRSGMTPTQIIETLVAKQKKNEGRTWPDWRTADPDKAIEHDRAGEQESAAAKGAGHPDDDAVDAFAAALKAKLAAARAKGRSGWNGDEPGMQQRLSDMLRAHVDKGDPRDVANFAMFLHQRGEAILPPQQENSHAQHGRGDSSAGPDAAELQAAPLEAAR